MMKKLLIVALASSTFVAATPAFANDSETTVIAATVPLVCDLSAPPSNGGINTNGSTALGTFSTECNSAGGYTVTIASLNNFKLVDATIGSGDSYPYSLSVDGTLTSAFPATFNSNQSFTLAHGYLPSMSGNVSVNTTGNGHNFAGVYQDTITWSITAN